MINSSINIFIIIFFLASCASGFIVKIDSDDAFNATKYKTFKVFKPDPFNVESDEEETEVEGYEELEEKLANLPKE